MAIHHLKCWPSNFERVRKGEKPFEVRVNDRDFADGDCVVLWHFDPLTKMFNGEGFQLTTIRNLIQGRHGLPSNVCVFSWVPEGTSHRRGYPGPGGPWTDENQHRNLEIW